MNNYKKIIVKKRVKGQLLQSSMQFLRAGDLFTIYSDDNKLKCNGLLLLATSNSYKNDNGELAINYVRGN